MSINSGRAAGGINKPSQTPAERQNRAGTEKEIYYMHTTFHKVNQPVIVMMYFVPNKVFTHIMEHSD